MTAPPTEFTISAPRNVRAVIYGGALRYRVELTNGDLPMLPYVDYVTLKSGFGTPAEADAFVARMRDPGALKEALVRARLPDMYPVAQMRVVQYEVMTQEQKWQQEDKERADTARVVNEMVYRQTGQSLPQLK